MGHCIWRQDGAAVSGSIQLTTAEEKGTKWILYYIDEPSWKWKCVWNSRWANDDPLQIRQNKRCFYNNWQQDVLDAENDQHCLISVHKAFQGLQQAHCGRRQVFPSGKVSHFVCVSSVIRWIRVLLNTTIYHSWKASNQMNAVLPITAPSTECTNQQNRLSSLYRLAQAITNILHCKLPMIGICTVEAIPSFCATLRQ